MSSRFQNPSRSAGFSLVEVLVALAIAAMMAAMLVRFLAGTRVNAARIGEALEMATLADTLLARVSSLHTVQPGRTDGRSGKFLWRIEVQSTAFTAVSTKVHKRGAPEAGDADKARIKITAKSVQSDAAGMTPAEAPGSKWLTYRIAVAIEAPSGRRHVADTVRIGPPPAAAER